MEFEKLIIRISFHFCNNQISGQRISLLADHCFGVLCDSGERWDLVCAWKRKHQLAWWCGRTLELPSCVEMVVWVMDYISTVVISDALLVHVRVIHDMIHNVIHIGLPVDRFDFCCSFFHHIVVFHLVESCLALTFCHLQI